MVKVSFIGAGNLGSFTAYETASRGIADEIVLIDINTDMAIGQANDINQAIAFKNSTKIKVGDYISLTNSDIIVVSAGKPRTPDIKDRLELGKINADIIKNIAKKIRQFAPKSIIITLSNPMDIMNYLMWKETRFDRFKVIGSGGQLDSARLHTVVKGENVFTLGEHGESQVPIFNKLDRECSSGDKVDIRKAIKQSAMNVISRKGSTIFAPASNTADMIEAIIKDKNSLMACSCVLDGEYWQKDLSIGVPVILGKNGIEKIEVWNLGEESKDFEESCTRVKKAIKDILG